MLLITVVALALVSSSMGQFAPPPPPPGSNGTLPFPPPPPQGGNPPPPPPGGNGTFLPPPPPPQLGNGTFLPLPPLPGNGTFQRRPKQLFVPNLNNIITQVQAMFPGLNIQQILQSNPQLSTLVQQQLPAIQAAIQQYMTTGSFSQLMNIANQLIGQVQISAPVSKQSALPDLSSIISQLQVMLPGLNVQQLAQNYWSMVLANPQLMNLVQQQLPTIQAAIQSGSFSQLMNIANQFLSSSQIQISAPVSKQSALPSLSTIISQVQAMFPGLNIQQYLQSNPQLLTLVQQQLPAIQAGVQQYLTTGSFSQLLSIAGQFISSGQVQISPPASKQLVIPNFDLSALLTQAQQAYPTLNIPQLFQLYLPVILSYPGLGQLVQQHQQEIQTAVATGDYRPLIELSTQLFSTGVIGGPNSKQSVDLQTLAALFSQNPQLSPYLPLIMKYADKIQSYLPQLIQYWPQLQQLMPNSVSMIPTITDLINQVGIDTFMQSILQALSNNSLVPHVQPVVGGN